MSAPQRAGTSIPRIARATPWPKAATISSIEAASFSLRTVSKPSSSRRTSARVRRVRSARNSSSRERARNVPRFGRFVTASVVARVKSRRSSSAAVGSRRAVNARKAVPRRTPDADEASGSLRDAISAMPPARRMPVAAKARNVSRRRFSLRASTHATPALTTRREATASPSSQRRGRGQREGEGGADERGNEHGEAQAARAEPEDPEKEEEPDRRQEKRESPHEAREDLLRDRDGHRREERGREPERDGEREDRVEAELGARPVPAQEKHREDAQRRREKRAEKHEDL